MMKTSILGLALLGVATAQYDKTITALGNDIIVSVPGGDLTVSFNPCAFSAGFDCFL
jgi:hypothetical protein